MRPRYTTAKDVLVFILIVAVVFMAVYSEMKIPDYMSKITTLMYQGESTEHILEQGLYMMIFAILALILSVIAAILSAYFASNFAKNLRATQYEQVEKFSMKEMNKFGISSLITRSTNDITQVQIILATGIVVVLKAPMLAALSILYISRSNMEWTLATASVIMIMVVIICVILFIVIPRFRKIQWMNDDINRLTKEHVNGLRVVRSYNSEEYHRKKFTSLNDRLTDMYVSVTRYNSVLSPVMTAETGLLTVIIYWIGAALVASAKTADMAGQLWSDMVSFTTYAMYIVTAVLLLVMVFMSLPRAIIAFRRVKDVIRTEPSMTDGDVENTDGMKGEVSFRNVSFRYPGNSEDTLSDISFDVKKGEFVAIIGPTGSGKTTLVNLIPRLYDVTDGTITVDGIDVRNHTFECLNDKLGFVPQNSMLFNDTVENNIRYGDSRNERTMDDVIRAAETARCSEFIENMPDGYSTVISGDGKNISGGQRQRLSIARAICKDPEIYIFDDSFSALDYETDRSLRRSLRENTDSTVIIVAQRVETIIDADMIIVMDSGRIVGCGTHEQLLKGCNTYSEIVQSQMPKEVSRG